MTDYSKLADAYIAAWNEPDADRRKGLLAAHWADDATYVDPLMNGQGHDQINALIGAVHDRFPEHRFSLAGHVDGHGDHLRFSWTLGPKTEPDMIVGTDFVRIEGGQMKSVIGFLDKVPEAA